MFHADITGLPVGMIYTGFQILSSRLHFSLKVLNLLPI